MQQAAESSAHDVLGGKFARSVRDNVLAECAIQVLRVGGMVILARALGAEDKPA